MVDKFSHHVHLRKGGLGDWCEHCSPRVRHAALTVVAKRDGWSEVSLRLNELANVTSPKTNAHGKKVAREDQRWAARHEPAFGDREKARHERERYARMRRE